MFSVIYYQVVTCIWLIFQHSCFRRDLPRGSLTFSAEGQLVVTAGKTF